jgi:hypothetical protein
VSIDSEWVLQELEETLGRLAQEAEAQLSYLGANELPVDELALEFDAVAPVAPALVAAGALTSEQASAVTAVHDKLSSMSGADQASLWTPEGLAEAPEWGEVRRLAANALRSLLQDEDSEPPK